MEAAVDEAIGEGDWVVAYEEPFVFMSDAAMAPERVDRALEAAATAATAFEGVHAAYYTADAEALRASGSGGRLAPSDDIARRVGLSIASGAPGPLFIVPDEHYFADDHPPEDRGTSHGTPWPYDRRVPVLFSGPGVTALHGEEALDQRRVAPTVASLMAIPAPNAATEEPLPGAD